MRANTGTDLKGEESIINAYTWVGRVHDNGNTLATMSVITDFGKDAQYGRDTFSVYGYPEFIGRTHTDNCQPSTE